MIEIRKMPDGNPMLISSVSDFCSSMGYCEFRIKHFLKGIKAPDTEITIEGTKSHEEDAEYEKEHFEFVPLSQEELEDTNKDIEFPFEATYTRLLTEIKLGNENLPMLIFGQADKVGRSKGQLIVEESKYPDKVEKYLERPEPYDDQKMQVLLYLKSRFSNNGSLDSEEWFEIPHNEKVWVINIKDKKTRETKKFFRGTQTKEDEEFLNEKLGKFALIALGILEPEHHQNVKKCKSCRFEDCEYKLS